MFHQIQHIVCNIWQIRFFQFKWNFPVAAAQKFSGGPPSTPPDPPPNDRCGRRFEDIFMAFLSIRFSCSQNDEVGWSGILGGGHLGRRAVFLIPPHAAGHLQCRRQLHGGAVPHQLLSVPPRVSERGLWHVNPITWDVNVDTCRYMSMSL